MIALAYFASVLILGSALSLATNLETRKVGGIRFLSVGRFGASFYVKRGN